MTTEGAEMPIDLRPKVDPNYRAHCWDCGRFVPLENETAVYDPYMGAYEASGTFCSPKKGCRS